MALVPTDFARALPVHTLHSERAGEEGRDLIAHYRRVRAFSRELCEPLQTEDYVVQTMPDVSPTKWHLMHTTWFFETFLLKPHLPGYQVFHPQFEYLFNSYYNAVGPQFPRPRRGNLSRPTVAEVEDYRQHVDEHVLRLLQRASAPFDTLEPLVELGIQHEQQHQELMVTDFKHVLCSNPLHPVYRKSGLARNTETGPLHWLEQPGGLVEIGYSGGEFSYDNESPRHRHFLEPFAIGARLVTNGDYLEFIHDGGYRTPALWLSEGWTHAQQESWQAPLYWELRDGAWWQATLAGFQPVNPHEPVCHVSYFEADAYARWAGARLPTEYEWESVAQTQPIRGNFVESRRFHPAPPPEAPSTDVVQLFGDVWEWTSSAYLPYPGYRAAEGALGEYNGKFMVNQMVLRGGSCATSITHIRPTYRNFFPSHARWQFMGLRLARSAS